MQKTLETIVGRLVLEGATHEVKVTRTTGANDAMNAAAACTAEDTDLIIGCGGDGTINEIVNGLMRSQSHVPMAILAAGTSNDFAVSLRLPENADDFCQMIKDGCYRDIDVGLANDSYYFANVASFGMFTSVAHTTERKAKNSLGRLAYYIKAASTAPEQFKKYTQLRINVDGKILKGEFLLAIVANSTSIGSFRNLMYKANVSDGMFDVLLMKRPGIPVSEGEGEGEDVPAGPFLLKYLQAAEISFEPLDEKNIEVDLDGEAFGTLPLSVKTCHNAIKLLVPAAKKAAAK